MVDRVGDDEGDGVADMAHLAFGQDRIGRTGEGIDLEIEQARQVAEIADVVRRQHQRDAGQARARRGIDGELGMRMRRAQHQRVQRRLRRDVVGIAALAADERVVLLAKHALTDAEFDGSSHLVSDFPFRLSAILQRIAGQRKRALALDQRAQPARSEQAEDQAGIDHGADADQQQQDRSHPGIGRR